MSRRPCALVVLAVSSLAAAGCSSPSSEASSAQADQPTPAGTPAAPSQMRVTTAGVGAQQTTGAAKSGGLSSAAGSSAATSSTAGSSSATPAAGSSAMPAAGSSALPTAGKAASAAGSGGAAGATAGATPGQTPVYRIPLRLHVGMSQLTDRELIPILEEMNRIWLSQAGICFEIEVTESEDNRSDGFDFRYTSGRIPSAPSANGVTQSAHEIWSVDHPRLSDAPNPVMFPTARTTAHELGHALGLAHENPPPSTDCASPCYCDMRGDDCDDYLLRSGTMGFFVSPPEVEITRQHAAKVSMSDHAPTQCGMASIQR